MAINIHWNKIENLPIKTGFYLVTFAHKDFGHIRITRMAEFSGGKFKPMLVEAYFDSVKRGLEREWELIAWADAPLPDLSGLTVADVEDVGYETTLSGILAEGVAESANQTI